MFDLRLPCRFFGVALVWIATMPLGVRAAQVDEIAIPQTQVLQGDPLIVSCRVGRGGARFSVTVFAHPGDLATAPEVWQKSAIRTEPRYQISNMNMEGKSRRVSATFPGFVTKPLAPGPYTVFIAVSDPPANWRIVRAGVVRILAANRIAVPAREGPSRVAIWWDPRIGGSSDAVARRVADAARAVDAQPTVLTTDEMRDSRVFNRDRYDVLVLPHADAFPAVEPVARFLQHAGTVVNLGGLPFMRVAGQDDRNVASRMLADMEDGVRVAAFPTEKGPKTQGRLTQAAPGAAGTGHALRMDLAAPLDWFYIRIPCGSLSAGGLRFWAKGDRATSRLCLELKAKDGSRWKYHVDLGEEWRQYDVRVDDFAAYASPKRGLLGDCLQPDEITQLTIGFYRALFDEDQPHAFWIDEVQSCPAPARSAEERVAHIERWESYYNALKIRPGLDRLGIWQRARHFPAAALVPAAPLRLSPANPTPRGLFSCWVPTPLDTCDQADVGNAPPTPSTRVVPLLIAQDAQGHALGAAASLLFHYRGPYRGARVVAWCMDDDQLLLGGTPVFKDALVALLRVAVAPCRLFNLEPRFNVADAAMRQTWSLQAVNLSGRTQDLEVRVQPSGGEIAQVRKVTLPSGEERGIDLDFPAGNIDLRRFGATASLLQSGEIVDELRAEANALRALESAAAWLMAGQTDEGNYSKYYYADSYGARSLLALGRETQRTAYVESALRFTDKILRDQREDGGWWVGYDAAGECVFVADDGSIALGLVQIASRTDPTRRRRYVDAAKRYLTFRESFRITDAVAQTLEKEYGVGHAGILRGGLGIGLVRTDFFTNVRYPEQHREMRQRPWTLDCSLAFLGGLWRLTGDAAYRDLARQDTRWFLARCREKQNSVKNSYANEAAVWMYDILDDAGLHAELETALRREFLEHVANTPHSWWTASDGRGALLLPGLAYCARQLDSTPAVRAALARALWSIGADTSPLSIQQVAARTPKRRPCPAIMYVCFSANGLAEVLWPRSIFMP